MAQTGCLSPRAASLTVPGLPGHGRLIPAPAEGSAPELRGGGAGCQPSRRIHVTGARHRVLPRCGQGCAWSGMRCVRDQLNTPASALPNAGTRTRLLQAHLGTGSSTSAECQCGSPCLQAVARGWQVGLQRCQEGGSAGSGVAHPQLPHLLAAAAGAPGWNILHAAQRCRLRSFAL